MQSIKKRVRVQDLHISKQNKDQGGALLQIHYFVTYQRNNLASQAFCNSKGETGSYKTLAALGGFVILDTKPL